uniref:Uncharacterized protein n=1 Tax=Avena sativa TaxID=4498 RepID=A0ACD5V5U0_AVESA
MGRDQLQPRQEGRRYFAAFSGTSGVHLTVPCQPHRLAATQPVRQLAVLSGGLPPELVRSSSILVLDVSFNSLTGGLAELPSSTAETPMQVLNISSNQFTGRFPSTSWEVMKSLVTLNASNNSFSGQIPATYCLSAPSFAVLELSFNQFSGNIPRGLNNCTMLKMLAAGYNHLSGTFSEEIFNVTSLEHLSLPSNQLQGSLHGISKLTNMVTLDLGGNDISGNIPEAIGDLNRLEELHLDYNIMSGELPAALSNCTNIITIDLRTNHFSGELTKVNFSNMSNLKKIDLLYNSFTGTIPESIYSCSRLIALRLSGNKLDGQLSPRISNLKYLAFLSLGINSFTNITNALHILKISRNLATLFIGNNFKGELMPDDDIIDGFDNLHALDIQGCQLSGKIPLWISRLANLNMLLLNNNQLTGPIPGWINSLSHLFFMDVSNNNLTGEIPLNLTEMPMLKSTGDATQFDLVFQLPVYNCPLLQYRVVTSVPTVLNLSHNYFTGVIPPQIGQLKELGVLDFSFNKLSGQIPKSIGNIINLLLLDLSNNHLMGAIPGALDNLHFLGAFNVSDNDLEGPVPSGGQFNTFGASSFDGNTHLCGPMLIHKCGSAQAPPTTILSTKQINYKVPFGIAFSAFFVVGVLYDQIVLSRYFRCIY